MNANELADELVEWYEDYNGRFDLIDEAVAMLRQLQAENKDKKLVNDTFADLIKKQGEKIDAQQTKLDVAEQQILDAFERGKMFGYAEGLRKAKVKLVSELTVKKLQNLLKKQEK